MEISKFFSVISPLRRAFCYRYDAQGRRVRTASTAGTLYEMYSLDGKLLWQRDEQLGLRFQHVYLGGSLVASQRLEIGGTNISVTYRHTDALGSPIAATDAAGSVVQTTEHEPYGRMLNRTNDNRPGYAGHVMDQATGMVYMQQRYYDPLIPRFLSVDPITAYSNPVGAFNRYWYANNNPYRFTDPDGRAPSGCDSDTCKPPPLPKTLEAITVTAPKISQVASNSQPHGSFRPQHAPSFFQLTTFAALRKDMSVSQAVEAGVQTRTVTLPAMVVTASSTTLVPIVVEGAPVAGRAVLGGITSKKGREIVFVGCQAIGYCQGRGLNTEKIEAEAMLMEARAGALRQATQQTRVTSP